MSTGSMFTRSSSDEGNLCSSPQTPRSTSSSPRPGPSATGLSCSATGDLMQKRHDDRAMDQTGVVASKRSAGILLFRRRSGQLEVLLGHMGGPFWARKDDGAWSIPKGEIDPDEDQLAAARREFAEELGLAV